MRNKRLAFRFIIKKKFRGSGTMLFGVFFMMAFFAFVMMFAEIYAMEDSYLSSKAATDTISDGTAVYSADSNVYDDDARYSGAEIKAVEICNVIEDETGINIGTVSIDEDLYTGDNLVEVSTETDYGYLTGMFGSSYSLSLTSATAFPQLVLYAPGSCAQNMTVPNNGSSLPVMYYCQGSGAAWASQAFGGGTIASSGCSVTSLAMVVTYLTGRYVYPNDIVNKIAEETGDYNTFYVDPVGQSHDIFGAVAGYYGLNCASISSASIPQAIAAGHPVIMSCVPGEFTDVGHFIVITGRLSNGNYAVNDPNGGHADKSFTNGGYSLEYLTSQGKGWWEFW